MSTKSKFKKGQIPWNKGKKTGQIPWNKGKKLPEETKRKLSLALKGRPGTFKGKKHSEEAKEKNRLAHLGQTSWLKGKKGYTNSGSFKKGHKHTEVVLEKIRKTLKGRPGTFKGKKHSAKNIQKQKERMLRTIKDNPEVLKRLARTGFKKGHTPSNKGTKASPELRQKLSVAQKKKYANGFQVWNKGKKMPEATKRKLSLARKGVKYAPGRFSAMKGRKHTEKAKRKASASIKKYLEKHGGFGEEHIRKIRLANTGKRRSEEIKKAMSERMKKVYADGFQVWNKGKTGLLSEEALGKIRKARSKQVFPRHDSDAEKKLQNICKTAQIQYVKHKNINLGFQWHQVDLFIEPNICLEADGDFWHANPNPWINKGSWIVGFKADDHIIGKTYAKDKWASDKKVTLALEEMGYKVLRFWGTELETEPEKCFQKIIKIIKESKRQHIKSNF